MPPIVPIGEQLEDYYPPPMEELETPCPTCGGTLMHKIDSRVAVCATCLKDFNFPDITPRNDK